MDNHKILMEAILEGLKSVTLLREFTVTAIPPTCYSPATSVELVYKAGGDRTHIFQITVAQSDYITVPISTDSGKNY